MDCSCVVEFRDGDRFSHLKAIARMRQTYFRYTNPYPDRAYFLITRGPAGGASMIQRVHETGR
jgi:hypothetical protein